MVVRIWSLLFFLTAGFAGILLAEEKALFAPEERSKAYAQYLVRPKTDQSRLLYLIDRFRDTDAQVIYNGYYYDARESAMRARNYLFRHYKKGESAEKWIKIHAYRSLGQKQIIYLVYPDGSQSPLRDVFLEELRQLEEMERVK